MEKNDPSQEVRKGEELNLPKLTAFLQEKGLIDTDQLEVRQYPGGYSNLTYLLKTPHQDFVLRRPPIGTQVKRGHDMSREFKVLSRLHPVFPKAPEAYVFTEDPQIIGAPFYVMEKVDGIILRVKEVKKRNIPASDFATIADSWLDTFVELHQADYQAAGLADLGRPEGYVERQVRIWSEQYLKAKTDEVPVAEKLMDWMKNNQPTQYTFSLIHNDYKYDNIVFADNQWKKVRAVLDWEMCTIGDPLMDLGTSLGYWVTYSDPDIMKGGLPSPTIFEGNPSRAEVVASYEKKAGRAVDHLIFYYVYGLFKIAVIAQQIYYRYKKGFTKDERFAQLNQAAALLCTTAWQAVQKKRIDDLF
jgi:aminoglycoside phosphotransferase (APT) family kinase protein